MRASQDLVLEGRCQNGMLQEKVQKNLKITAKICIKGKVMQNSERRVFPCEIFLMTMWQII